MSYWTTGHHSCSQQCPRFFVFHINGVALTHTTLRVGKINVCVSFYSNLCYQTAKVFPLDEFSPMSSCSQGSTSSSMSDHWLIRLTEDSKRGSMVSRTSTTFPPSIPDSPESPVFLEADTHKEKGNRIRLEDLLRCFFVCCFSLF